MHWNVHGVVDATCLLPVAPTAACVRVTAWARWFHVTGDPAAVTCKKCVQTVAFKMGQEIAAAKARMRDSVPEKYPLPSHPLPTPSGYGRRAGDRQLRSHGEEPDAEYRLTALVAVLVAAKRLLAWAETAAKSLPEGQDGVAERTAIRQALQRVRQN